MKKILLTLFAASLLSLGIHTAAQAQFSLGIKAGPNFSNLNTDAGAKANYQNRTGFHAGAYALFKFSKVGIQPEVLFSQQGSTVKINQNDYKSNFSYINIPIIVKLYTIAGINLQVGPQFGFLTSAKSGYNPITEAPYTSTEDVKNLLNKSDVSLALGVGWDLPFGLSISGRYNWGLNKVNSGGNAVIKNQVWQFAVGYRLFKIGDSK